LTFYFAVLSSALTIDQELFIDRPRKKVSHMYVITFCIFLHWLSQQSLFELNAVKSRRWSNAGRPIVTNWLVA